MSNVFNDQFTMKIKLQVLFDFQIRKPLIGTQLSLLLQEKK